MIRHRQRRAGFTLVEILMVVAIIAILMGLLTGASVKYIEVQQRSNTQATLDKAESQLKKVWSQVKDQAYKEKIHDGQVYDPVTNIAKYDPKDDTQSWLMNNLVGQGDTNIAGRMRIIYVKLRLRQAFPMNFNEALFPPVGNSGPCPCYQLQPLPSYVKYLNNHGIGLSSGLNWESSACLLMALTRGPNGIAPDTLQSGGAGGIDDQSYGVPILNDAWGRPIYFTRVPYACPLLNPNGAHPDSTDSPPYPVSYDVLDPNGYLQQAQWGTTYGPLFTSITLQPMAPANHSYKLQPMVASGGPGKTPQPSLNTISFAPLPNGEPMFNNP